MLLFIDTETTGFFKKGPTKQDGQARVCQLAMLATDNDGKSLAEFSFLIKPDNWTINPKASEIHGFDDELCEKNGIPSGLAITLFQEMAEKSDLIIAHNKQFDSKMMDIELAYNMQPYRPQNKWICTMLRSMNICKIPGRYGDYKWPKLNEALKELCGREMGDEAHDALWDTRACRDIFFALVERGEIKLPKKESKDERI